MKILFIHNYYQQAGGEDQVFADELHAMKSHGHQVIPLTFHNDVIEGMSRLTVAGRTVWSRESHRKIREICRRERPDVVHLQNTFPLVSPAVYYAIRAEGIPVIQELQNYRLLCPGAYLLRDGKVCEKCVGKVIPWPAVQHSCYRGSRVMTGVIAGMLGTHHLLGTWTRAVDAYLVVTEFGRRKFIEGGLPEKKIWVKPNWMDSDPGLGAGDGGYAVFVGRLSPEKGIDTLLEAWSLLGDEIPLKILGDGPMADTVRAAAERMPSVRWLGRRPTEEVLDVVGGAKFLVCPSKWYEGFPKTIVESLAKGTPVIASRLGAMEEVIEHGATGRHFEPGNAGDLVEQVRKMNGDSGMLAAMREKCRAQYLAHYSAERGYQRLFQIYQEVLAAHRGRTTNTRVMEGIATR